MKRIIIAVGFVLMLASCNETKIAYVNVDDVLKEYEGSRNAEKSMREKSDKIMAELEPITQEFQAKVQEFQKNSSTLSANDRAEQEQQLMQEQQFIQQRQQMAQQQVQQEGRQMYNDIDKKIDSLIGVYAKSKGYSFVLGTSPQTKSVLYGNEKDNITDDVIESLNNTYTSSQKMPAEADNKENDTVK